jgi:hypothetical protein
MGVDLRALGKGRKFFDNHDTASKFCEALYPLPVFGASKTAEWAGHSEEMLFKTYRRKVSPAHAKAFWEIFPE